MANVLAQVSIPMDTGVPADAVVNTWHFSMVTQNPSDYTAITTALDAFYTGIAPILSSKIAHTALRVKYYDVNDPKPRPPRAEEVFGIASPLASTPLPPELAVCLSYKSTVNAGEKPAWRRNRVYLGPTNSNINGSGVIFGSDITIIINAAAALLSASTADTNWTWMTFSNVLHAAGGTPVSYTAPVTGGWVDDAWDIQRRRGVKASTRQTFGT